MPEASAQRQKNMTKSVGQTFASWEAELNQGIKFGMERLLQQGLSLTDYELQNIPIAVAALETDRIAADTKIPVYDDPADENGFTLQSFGDLSEELRKGCLQYKAARFEQCAAENVRIVVMTWRYGNETFETECYVTDDRIVYDPILSNIRFVNYSNEPIIVPIPTIKPKGEPGGNYTLNSSYSEAVSYEGFTGSIAAQASVRVVLLGNRNADGQKCVENFIAEAPYDADPWYGASSEIKVSAFEPGPNGYIEFEYAIGVSGFGGTVSFGYTNGIGFTIPSGVHGKTAKIRINASDLR